MVTPTDALVEPGVLLIAHWVEATAEALTGSAVHVVINPPLDPARPVQLEVQVYQEARGRLLGVQGQTITLVRRLVSRIAGRLGVQVTVDVVQV